jgi:hypothetical protein
MSEKPRDPIEELFGKQVDESYYAGAPDSTQPPLPGDQIQEIQAFIAANTDTLIAQKGRLKFNDKLDIALVKTPFKAESIKIRKGNRGSTNIGLVYEHSPSGFIGVFSNVPGIFNDLEPNTAYFIVGKWKEGEYQGLPSYSVTNCRAIIKASPKQAVEGGM